MSARLNDLVSKATKVYQHWKGDFNPFFGREGDIVFSKNNVCVHTSVPGVAGEVESQHCPGYLTIHCQRCEVLGITLVLQWMPNATLQTNPRAIRTMSPRRTQHDPARAKIKIRNRQQHNFNSAKMDDPDSSESESEAGQQQGSAPTEKTVEVEESRVTTTYKFHPAPVAVNLPNQDNDDNDADNESNDDTVTNHKDSAEKQEKEITENHAPPRPTFMNANNSTSGNVMGVPNINVIPHTPVDPQARRFSDYIVDPVKPTENCSTGHEETVQEGNEVEEQPDSAEKQRHESSSTSCGGDKTEPEETETSIADVTQSGSGHVIDSVLLSQLHADVFVKTPEQFAASHNLQFADGTADESTQATANSNSSGGTTQFRRSRLDHCALVSLFSVDLGKMRTLRLFYNDAPECTSGQLVIASEEKQYKILHFHTGGLEKLAKLFEQWSALRARSLKDGSPSPITDRHFAICRADVAQTELDPEEGLYEPVTSEFWKASTNEYGAIQDNSLIRKAIYFAGVDVSLRREAWPFLLNVYPWNSTFEERDSIRNDLFLKYQQIRDKRMHEATGATEHAILKDVVRTDRKKPYYAGENNPNVNMMKDILLNYAVYHPEIGYMQGMSDLLAPILATIIDEANAFWCFAGVVQRAVFVIAPEGNNTIDSTLDYLRELLKLFYPDFFKYLQSTNSPDAMQLLFTHRWILLLFKREFTEEHVTPLWEAFWSAYRTDYFHLFVCLAIIMVYGEDCIQQKLSHDELLLYFSSLAMHIDAVQIMKKARGLLYQFCRRDRIPCTLAAIRTPTKDQWDSAYQPMIECVQMHDKEESCPSQT